MKQGHTNRKIAEELKISEHTVRNHVSAIFQKLGVTARLQLAIYAHKNKL